MHKFLLAALALGAASFPTTAMAQEATQLHINATGEVTRVPDLALISAGVQTVQPTASAAIEQNAVRMERVRAVLKRAGIDDRDIQTASIKLYPEYRHEQNQPPRLTGYRATNTVDVKFRDLKRTGAILDTLVTEGANQINGPWLSIDKPESALDEARVKAIANGRARAELYAQTLGKRVVRLRSISEIGGPPTILDLDRVDALAGAQTIRNDINPGTQQIQVNVSMSFELQ